MQWFGPAPWALICRDTERVDVPVGQPCGWCAEPLRPGDEGLLIPHLSGDRCGPVPYHAECNLRQVLGSVAHQGRRCSCFGGAFEDDPALSKREAARAAIREFERKRRFLSN